MRLGSESRSGRMRSGRTHSVFKRPVRGEEKIDMKTTVTSRRNMMRSVTGGALSGLLQSKSARAQSANNKVVLGLIGAGGRGTVLGGNLAVVENTEFKYICEVNAERGEPLMRKLEEIHGKRPRRVTDMREVFDDKDVDGVVIATPEH